MHVQSATLLPVQQFGLSKPVDLKRNGGFPLMENVQSPGKLIGPFYLRSAELASQ